MASTYGVQALRSTPGRASAIDPGQDQGDESQEQHARNQKEHGAIAAAAVGIQGLEKPALPSLQLAPSGRLLSGKLPDGALQPLEPLGHQRHLALQLLASLSEPVSAAGNRVIEQGLR